MIAVLRRSCGAWSPSNGGQTERRGPRARDGTHGTGPGAALLETAAILPSLSFEITGKAGGYRTVGHRRNRRDRCPRNKTGTCVGLYGIGSGADEYRLLVDAERGVLLRSEALLSGEPFQVLRG